MTAIRIHVNGICAKKNFSLMIVKKKKPSGFFFIGRYLYIFAYKVFNPLRLW